MSESLNPERRETIGRGGIILPEAITNPESNYDIVKYFRLLFELNDRRHWYGGDSEAVLPQPDPLLPEKLLISPANESGNMYILLGNKEELGPIIVDGEECLYNAEDNHLNPFNADYREHYHLLELPASQVRARPVSIIEANYTHRVGADTDYLGHLVTWLKLDNITFPEHDFYNIVGQGWQTDKVTEKIIELLS